MNISYKRDMTHNYMVPELSEGICEDDYRVHMLMENHIRGLLPCSIKRVNCQTRFFYDITSRQSMEHIYGKGRMGVEDIGILLRGLHRTLKEVKKYLLEEDQIVLEPEMIYMDIETREPLFCYLPGYQKDIIQSFRELSAYLLEHLNRSDSRAVLLGYEVYQKAREENYSLEKILQEAGMPQAAPDDRPPMGFAEEQHPRAGYGESAGLYGGTGRVEESYGGIGYGESAGAHGSAKRGENLRGEDLRGGTGYVGGSYSGVGYGESAGAHGSAKRGENLRGEDLRGGTGYMGEPYGGAGYWESAGAHGGAKRGENLRGEDLRGGTGYMRESYGGIGYGESAGAHGGAEYEESAGTRGKKRKKTARGIKRGGNLRGSIGRGEDYSGAGCSENLYGGAGRSENLYGGAGHSESLYGGAGRSENLYGGSGYSENLYGGAGRNGDLYGGAGYGEDLWEDARRRDDARQPKKHSSQKKEKEKPQKESRKKKKERESQELSHSGKAQGENKSGRMFLAVCFVMAIVLLLAAAWFWGLSTTQIGGIAFLLAAILAYGFTMEGKSRKGKERRENRQMEDVLDQFQEEPYYEEAYQPQPSYLRDRGGYGSSYGAGANANMGANTGSYGTGVGTNMGGYGAGISANAGSYGPGVGANMGNYGAGMNTNMGANTGSYGTGVGTNMGGYGAGISANAGSYGPGVGANTGSYGAGMNTNMGANTGSYGSGMGTNAGADNYMEQKRKSRLGDTGILFEDGDFVQRLVLVSMNPRQKDSFILERDSYIVGKLPERCDIVIDHPSVSRVHARLERQGKDYYLCDLNSTNGTFLNGKRLMVNEKALIHPGDEIGFARVSYQVGRC